MSSLELLIYMIKKLKCPQYWKQPISSWGNISKWDKIYNQTNVMIKGSHDVLSSDIRRLINWFPDHTLAILKKLKAFEKSLFLTHNVICARLLTEILSGENGGTSKGKAKGKELEWDEKGTKKLCIEETEVDKPSFDEQEELYALTFRKSCDYLFLSDHQEIGCGENSGPKCKDSLDRGKTDFMDVVKVARSQHIAFQTLCFETSGLNPLPTHCARCMGADCHSFFSANRISYSFLYFAASEWRIIWNLVVGIGVIADS
ncbi:hypothetical protein G9A89_015011 [Geosiphon pyriformis]|nr:hypothetical protein G9A89_015011 [Geosiphon pyriformis]